MEAENDQTHFYDIFPVKRAFGGSGSEYNGLVSAMKVDH